MEKGRSMMTELLTAGWQLHQAGDLPRAEQAYRQLLHREPEHKTREFFLTERQSALDEQAIIAIVRSDHRIPVRRKKMPKNERAFIVSEIGGRASGVPKEEIGDRAMLLFLELQQERRGEVYCRAHLRVFFQQHRHVKVPLRRMKAHPGKRRGAGDAISVIRLVQMPEDGESNLFHESFFLDG